METNIEEIIKRNVLDQSHLADLLTEANANNESLKLELQKKIIELVSQGMVEVYTYKEGKEKIHSLSRDEAIPILSNLGN